ncbi:MAG: hypothetical protein WCG31_05445 [Deltaproteobacteria bacterium]|jgi:hypothetical protein
MNDNRDERLDRFFSAARSVRAETSAIEEFFENRLLASLREKRESRQTWFSWTWRLVPIFVFAFIILGSVSLIFEGWSSTDIFSAIANGNDDYQVVAYLEGE